MDIIWYGQATFKVKGKNTSAIIDPFDPDFIGLKLPKDFSADLALVTHEHKDHSNVKDVTGDPLIVTGPGEYESKGISVVGVSTFHDKSQGQERGKNTIYNLLVDGVNIVHLGDLGDKLTEEQIEELGQTDILMVPVGGVYTIDAKTATEVVAQLEPRIIIPMHYGGLPGLKVDLSPVEDFLKEMGVENVEPQAKLSITKEKLPDEPQVIVLNKS